MALTLLKYCKYSASELAVTPVKNLQCLLVRFTNCLWYQGKKSRSFHSAIKKVASHLNWGCTVFPGSLFFHFLYLSSHENPGIKWMCRNLGILFPVLVPWNSFTSPHSSSPHLSFYFVVFKTVAFKQYRAVMPRIRLIFLYVS